MLIGVPKECKNNEYRVGLLPSGVQELTQAGHQVFLEQGAGVGTDIPDPEYIAAGASILPDKARVYAEAELIVKVKEPQPEEYPLLQEEQALFCFFHFAGSKELTEAMLAKKITALALETLALPTGELPCLTPMSEVAGRMSVHEGAKYLEKPFHGRGLLLGGVPGVAPAEVVILGAGVVGTNACKMAAGMGANVTLLDIDLKKLRYLSDVMPNNVHTLMASPHNVIDRVTHADLVISSVMIRGARAPLLVSEDIVQQMRKGSVVIDVAIDQGGSFATSHPTTFAKPTYVTHDIVHYCVSNMPSAVARTSTYALTNATFSYIQQISRLGIQKALKESPILQSALNMEKGIITLPQISAAF